MLLMSILGTLLSTVLLRSSSEGRLLKIRIGSPVINTTRVPEIWGLSWHGPLIDFGIRYVQKLYADTFEISQTYLFDNRRDNEVLLYDDVQNFVAKYYYQNDKSADAVAFLSGASRSIEQSVHMTKELRTFHGTGLGNGPAHDENPQYVSLAVYSEQAIYSCVCTFMDRLNWTSVSSIVDDASIRTMGMLSAIHEDFALKFGKKGTRSANFQYLPFIYKRGEGPAELRRLFRLLSEVSRIVFVLASPERFRKIMIEAQKANLTNGDYVFFYGVLQKDGLPTALKRNYTWRIGDEDDKLAYQAYKSVILLSHIVSFPDDPLPGFRSQVLEIAKTKYNFTYPERMVPSNVYPSFELVLLYFMVLNQTLTKGGNISNGYDVAACMINRTFSLPTGELYIDETGERLIKISADFMDPVSGEFVRAYHYSPIGFNLTSVVDLRSYWPGRRWPVPNEPVCGFLGNHCADYGDQRTLIAAVVSALCLTGVIIAAAVGGWMRWRLVGSRWWLIPETEITENKEVSKLMRQSILSKRNEDSIAKHRVVRLVRGDVLWSTPIEQWQKGQRINVSMRLLRFIRDVGNLHHDNVNPFRGLCEEKLPALMFEAYCVRGSLADLVGEMENPELDLKISMLTDLLAGVLYIHKSHLKFHGHLRTTKCVLDSRLGLKVSDTGKERILALITGRGFQDIRLSAIVSSGTTKKLLCSAPEVLHGEPPTDRSDVYSFGIIAHAILLHKRPFGWPHEPDDTEALGMIEKILVGGQSPFRPQFEAQEKPMPVLVELASLVRQCWEEEPADRITLFRFNIQLSGLLNARKIKHGGTFFEKVMSRLNAYSETLEMNVEKKTQQLMVERRKCEDLLLEMFPRDVLRRLQDGMEVAPENFDSVTVFFSYIVGFVDFVSGTTPEETMSFLDRVYNDFDHSIAEFDVYKVETIGDSYMVASGLPIRNGSRHIVEVCRMSLQLRTVLCRVTAKVPMELKVGIHSGQVVAGVVGSKSPRYCLFGDAVNTASRMASFGLPSKIHLSTWAASAAASHGFVLESRGEMEIKGKGIIETFWLAADIAY